MPRRLPLLALILLLPTLVIASAGGEWGAERGTARKALGALGRGDLSTYRKLEKSLRDYPLYPYLRYRYLRKNLKSAPPQEVHAFLTKYADTPWAERLRDAWLLQLAKQRAWKEYLSDFSSGQSTRLQCHQLTARLKTGEHDAALWRDIEALWLTGRSRPDECDTAFEAWRAAGRMSREKVLARIRLAMEARQLSLATYLKGLLPKSDRVWVERWQAMHRNPEKGLEGFAPSTREPQWSALLFAHTLRRLARHDAAKALELWEAERARYALDKEQIEAVTETLGYQLATQHAPQATAFLREARKEMKAGGELPLWRVRNAIWHGLWEEVGAAIDALDESNRSEEEWRYWRARADQELGDTERARESLRDLAHCRCFHGLLAAARLGRDATIESRPLEITSWQLDKLAQLPGAQRAHELRQLHLFLDARREWRHFIRDMDEAALATAAKLAHQWQWHDQAILTLGKSGRHDDLELRFPTPYGDEIAREAKRQGVSDAFLYALIRQESAFRADARSSAGALGLMQLMPATARHTARLIKHSRPSVWEILNVRTNLHLGTAHLRELLDRYDGSRPLVLAAYNAGPHRVTRWLPEGESRPMEAWIANIPYRETRNYVQRILAYTAIYEWRLGRTPTPLTEHLPPAARGSAQERVIRTE